MRHMVSIQKVKDIRSIIGADFIEVCVINGWEVVVKVGEFKVGDMVVFFEIDSFIPYELVSWMEKGNKVREYNNRRGFRLRTVKLRNTVSQGLVLPIDILSEFEYDMIENYDVSQLLNVEKYCVEDSELGGDMLDWFPEKLIPKTDEVRIQNVYDILCEKYYNTAFDVTEKLDGASCTIVRYENESKVCGRNYALKEGGTQWKFHDIMLPFLEGKNIGIQGEICGYKIQKNSLKLNKPVLFIFSIYLIDEKRYLTQNEREEMFKIMSNTCELNDDIRLVPYFGKVYPFRQDLHKLLHASEGKTIGGVDREGLVYELIIDGKRTSFKVINNQFLLKEQD